MNSHHPKHHSHKPFPKQARFEYKPSVQGGSPHTGSIVNRAYESTGPAGRFRGTAQQLVSIWQHHAREAQLRNDPVTMEACLQYAEHYRRIMNRIMEGIGDARTDPGR